MITVLVGCLLTNLPGAGAAPETYVIDPEHTFPSFEADHWGTSIWRGKFDSSAGVVSLDRAAQTGSVRVTVKLASVDFGHKELNRWARGPELFDTAKFSVAVYEGRLTGFQNGAPTRVDGELTLHGVTRPLALKINSFACRPHPFLNRPMCGADAFGTFRRDEFGLDAEKNHGFDMNVTLRIQVEAVKPK